MLTRYFILVISSLYLKDINCLQNDSNDVSNIIVSNINGGQSQGILQKSLNQIASNRGLPINLQQILNSRQATNGQPQQTSQQNLNPLTPASTYVDNAPSLSLQSLYQQTSPATPIQGYQQSFAVQRPGPTTPLLSNPSILQNSNYVDQPNLALGNVQYLQQQIPGTTAQIIATQPAGLTPQPYPTTAIPSSIQPVLNIPPSYNGGVINTIGDSSMVFPQNQQVPVMGVPSYVIERSEPVSYIQTPQFPTATVNNSPIAFYTPQESLQALDLGHMEYPNQLTTVNVVSPHLPTVPPMNPEQILENYLYGLAMSPNSYGAQFASGFPNSGSKPSTLKMLLPLILNLLRDRNNNDCDCCPNCGNKKQQLNNNAYGKENRRGYKQQRIRHTNDDLGEQDNISENENRMRSKRKNKIVKFDDSYEDYDRDDDYD